MSLKLRCMNCGWETHRKTIDSYCTKCNHLLTLVKIGIRDQVRNERAKRELQELENANESN